MLPRAVPPVKDFGLSASDTKGRVVAQQTSKRTAWPSRPLPAKLSEVLLKVRALGTRWNTLAPRMDCKGSQSSKCLVIQNLTETFSPGDGVCANVSTRDFSAASCVLPPEPRQPGGKGSGGRLHSSRLSFTSGKASPEKPGSARRPQVQQQQVKEGPHSAHPSTKAAQFTACSLGTKGRAKETQLGSTPCEAHKRTDSERPIDTFKTGRHIMHDGVAQQCSKCLAQCGTCWKLASCGCSAECRSHGITQSMAKKAAGLSTFLNQYLCRLLKRSTGPSGLGANSAGALAAANFVEQQGEECACGNLRFRGRQGLRARTDS